jgi:miniconductance mechanosensitive channel
MKTIIENLDAWIESFGGDTALMLKPILGVAVIFIAAFLLDRICRRLVIPSIHRITAKTETLWDNHLLNDEVLNNACSLIPPITIYLMVPMFIKDDSPFLTVFIKFCWVYITIVTIKLICSVITSLYTLSNEHEKLKNHSLKGFYQMLKLVVVCIGAIVIISTLIDKSPVAILTGLGAGTAILMLVFQDTIKGLVAGVQLMANDMLRPGDWITVPKYGADGDVLEVTLTTVKVRNWDKTIVTVPPYALINDSFQNWRGMFDIGGRRVKRSIYIDMNTVRFCTSEEVAEYMKQPWMEDYVKTGDAEVNLHVFRHYVEYYLRHHPEVNPEMTLIVRQLQPDSHGMPIELYFFSADTAWVKYEHLQAEVFDHILAMLGTFDLRVFQSPSGQDLQKIN